MEQENKMIAQKFYTEIVNKADIPTMDAIMSDAFIDHNASPGTPSGIDGFRQFLKMVSTAFPDIQVTVEDLIAENDKVVSRLTITGTQTGVLMGKIAPSGKQACWTGIDILKIEDGKITERWSQRDLLSMMKQIGVIPNE